MLVAVWAVGLLLLVLWSASMWVAYLGWTMLAALPWSQAAEAARSIQLPPLLELWLGDAWREWLGAMAPLLEWLMRTLQGSAGWLEGIVPVALIVLWGVGAIGLLAMTAVAAGALGWWRRRRRGHPAAAA